MTYNSTTDRGLSHRPAGQRYIQLPYDPTNDTFASGQTRYSRVFWGTASPEASIVGNVGDVYIRTAGGGSGAGTVIYHKVVGNGTNTGWEPVHPQQALDGWYHTNLGAGVSGTEMTRGVGWSNGVLVARPMIITGIWCLANAAVTAGALYVQASKNNVQNGTDLQATVNSGSAAVTLFSGALAYRGSTVVDRLSTGTGLAALSVVAGDYLTIRVRSDAGLLPAGTLDLIAGLLAVPN